MRRFLLCLIMAGGLAVISAPQARATIGLCGNSYAVLMTGEDPSLVQATGGATLPGAITQAVGVGQITFGAYGATAVEGGPGCLISSGELIYNAGDIQSNPIGAYFGPVYCYAAVSGLGTGLPCFDGEDHIEGSLTPGGPNGSYILSFDAAYSWFDTIETTGAIPFGFFVETTLGNSTALGSSVVPTYVAADQTDYVNSSLPGNGAPILSLTLSKQNTADITANQSSGCGQFGVAPYLGASALLCEGQGANLTDGVAAVQSLTTSTYSGTTIAGSSGATLGSYEIFGPAYYGNGSLSFNSNDSYVVPSSGPPPNNLDCPFTFDAGTAYSFWETSGSNSTCAINGDGTEDVAAFITSFPTPPGNPYCESAYTAGAGYADSAVVYGATDADSYIIVTGLFSDATGFVPPGEMAYCTAMVQSPAVAKLSNLTSASVIAIATTKTGSVKITNPTEAVCDIEVTTAGSTANGCTIAPLSVATYVPGPISGDLVAAPSCTCTGTYSSNDGGTTSALYITSQLCPITAASGQTAISGPPPGVAGSFTCK